MQGAEPLFFLDYLATGRLSPDVAEQVIAGVARGCRENGCALLGGETAEMPSFYADGEYDIAGTIVGVVEKSKIIDGRSIVPGDVLIGLPSAGLHTNGYSLARSVMFDLCGLKADTAVPELGTTAGDALLAPHRSYLNAMRPLVAAGLVKGMAHITGGGITENLPRTLPSGCAAEIDRTSWTAPPLFTFLQKRGGIAGGRVAAPHRGRGRQAARRPLPAGRAQGDGEGQARADDRLRGYGLAAGQGGRHGRLTDPRPQ